jgi:16S rRNA C967 or C1407 C5-methylase (RsmB/RsmF family)
MNSPVLEKIIRHYEPIAGGDAGTFSASMKKMTPFSFRVNTLKASVEEVLPRLEAQEIHATPVPWCSYAFTSDKPVGKTPEHNLGLVYIQELSSMMPPVVLEKELKAAAGLGGPALKTYVSDEKGAAIGSRMAEKTQRVVLDACASPGSKTTQMAAIMDNNGLLVANDSSFGRTKPLMFNLEKCGVKNCHITNYDIRRFGEIKISHRSRHSRSPTALFSSKSKFDVILLDVPCSGEGTLMDNPKALPLWSETRIRKLSRMQKEMIIKAYDMLIPGGVMVYSTYTFAPEENEMVVGHLLNKESTATLERAELPNFSFSPGITSWGGSALNNELAKCARIWPNLHAMGGFFIARISKPYV